MPSYLRTGLASLFLRHKLEKKGEYGDRVRNMECGLFTPQLFLDFWEATVFYNHLTDLLSKKHGTPYPKTSSLLCCSISFPLLISAILAIRGSRTVWHVEHPSTSAELHLAESHLDSFG